MQETHLRGVRLQAPVSPESSSASFAGDSSQKRPSPPVGSLSLFSAFPPVLEFPGQSRSKGTVPGEAGSRLPTLEGNVGTLACCSLP